MNGTYALLPNMNYKTKYNIIIQNLETFCVYLKYVFAKKLLQYGM